MTIVVLGCFGLVLLVSACIVAEVFAGARRRRGLGEEKTAGRVVKVRGPVRGQGEDGAPTEYVEVVVEYYTRHGEGPFVATRRLPMASRTLYAAEDRVIVSYDVRSPRRGRVEGRVSHWPQLGPRRSPVPQP
ncbi:hypothetical protein Kfla_0920 [Kribbella flavida DSM 17836]|uniref:DUF3592 domain-containing protein n=2 Tax=Kribbella flavida TaxID=182640 RepID=D2Q027_KRIFD|nr:hypothetical protein Kfla_0920 [Kribbella flavida DSM 17836]